MDILEFVKYLKGTESFKEIDYGDLIDEDACKILSEAYMISETVTRNIEVCESPNIFFSNEPDLKDLIKESMQNDFFFSLKRKRITSGNAAILFYIFDYIKDNKLNFHEIPQIVSKRILELAFCERVVSIRPPIDIIINNYEETFKLFEEHRRVIGNKVLIEQANRVATIHPDIVSKLTENDIRELKVENKKIVLNDKPLEFIGGAKYGISVGVFDLTKFC